MPSQTYTNSVTLTDATEFNNFDTAAYSALTAVAGTNTITATGPANYSLSYRLPFSFIPAATNTGATTLNISGAGAKAVFAGGAACTGGELVIGVPTIVIYDGTQYNIVGTVAMRGTSASTFTFNGSGGTSGSVTMTYQKVGNWVTLSIPAVGATSGTSSATFTANTALPAAIRPVTSQQVCSVAVIQNNAAGQTGAGILRIPTSGVLVFLRDGAGTAWTDGSTCGTTDAATFTYYVG